MNMENVLVLGVDIGIRICSADLSFAEIVKSAQIIICQSFQPHLLNMGACLVR